MEKEEFIQKASEFQTQKEMADSLGFSISWVKSHIKKYELKSKDIFKVREKKIINTRQTEGIYGSLLKNKNFI